MRLQTTKKEIIKQALHTEEQKKRYKILENFLETSFPRGNFDHTDNIAWVSPSGKLLGDLESHYKSAIEGLKQINIENVKKEFEAVKRFQMESGSVRIVVYNGEFNVDVHDKIFPEQLGTITRVAEKYPLFFYDIYDGTKVVAAGSSTQAFKTDLQRLNRIQMSYSKWAGIEDDNTD